MLAPEPIDPMEVAAQLFPDLPPGFPYENFETQELILPDGEDMGIKSDDDAINEDEIQTDTGFGACVGKSRVCLPGCLCCHSCDSCDCQMPAPEFLSPCGLSGTDLADLTDILCL